MLGGFETMVLDILLVKGKHKFEGLIKLQLDIINVLMVPILILLLSLLLQMTRMMINLM